MSGSAPLLLTYRALGLGDLLTSLPALRGLRAAFPDHQHLLATSGWLAPVVHLVDAVDGMRPVGELDVPPDVVAPDLAVNLHGCGPESHRAVLATSPGRLVGFHHPDVAATSGAPRWCSDEHEVVRWCRLLEECGIPADRADLDLDSPGSAAGAAGAAVVHPGAKSGARRWPPERFAAVVAHLRECRHDVVVTGSSDERAIAERVAEDGGLAPDAVLAGRTDLGELIAVVAAAPLVVCGDTGVAHLATALGTPSVVLFGPTDPARWGPPPERRDRHRVLWAGRTGNPLADEADAGLLDVGVDEVLRAIDDLRRAGLVAPPRSRGSRAGGFGHLLRDVGWRWLDAARFDVEDEEGRG